MDSLKALIREVPDFPKPGINFYDITTLLKDATGFKNVIDSLTELYRSTPIDVVLGIEARGFIIAPAVAYALGYGFIPVRKQKKLPAERARIEYQLEYGTDVLEIHKDAISPGQNVLIIDDVLATGGTAAAVAELVETLQGKVAGLCHAKGENVGLPPVWLIYITVDDLDLGIRRCQELGGKLLRPAISMGASGRFCVIEDPVGAICALYEAKS